MNTAYTTFEDVERDMMRPKRIPNMANLADLAKRAAALEAKQRRTAYALENIWGEMGNIVRELHLDTAR